MGKKIACFVFLIVGAGMVLHGVKSILDTRRYIKTATQVEARIISSEYSFQQKKLLIKGVYTSAAGEMINFDAQTPRDANELVAGGPLHILYSPKNTTDVRINSFTALYKSHTIFMVIGAIFIGASLCIYSIPRPAP